MVQRLIDSNPEQPRPESSRGIELLQSLVSFEERFLGEVFGLFDALHKLQDDTDQPAFVTHDQLTERLLAAMTCLIHQPRLIRRAAEVIRLEGRQVRKCHCAVHECHRPESTPVVATVLDASSYANGKKKLTHRSLTRKRRMFGIPSFAYASGFNCRSDNFCRSPDADRIVAAGRNRCLVPAILLASRPVQTGLSEMRCLDGSV